MKLHITQLPCEETIFLEKLAQYRSEREAHKLTVGIPAPFPEYEIMRVIVDAGGPLEIVRDELQEQAAKVSRNALSELDLLKEEVAFLRAQMSSLDAQVVTLSDAKIVSG